MDVSMAEVKMVVVGGGGVGKSALTIQFIQGAFVEEYDPTIEDTYRKQVMVDEQVALLDILDTAGQEEYSAMRDQYMRSGEGFLLVYSITSRSSFDEITSFKEQIDKVNYDTREWTPAVLVGNKADLEADRDVTQAEGVERGKAFGCPFMEASAKSGLNCETVFITLVQEVRRARGERGVGGKGKGKREKKCEVL